MSSEGAEKAERWRFVTVDGDVIEVDEQLRIARYVTGAYEGSRLTVQWKKYDYIDLKDNGLLIVWPKEEPLTGEEPEMIEDGPDAEVRATTWTAPLLTVSKLEDPEQG